MTIPRAAEQSAGIFVIEYPDISTLLAWLEGLGLGKYAETFAENEIELGDLPHLTEADLRELGLPMGPRKRILNAFRDTPAAEGGDATSPATKDDGSRLEAHGGQAERRQLTVMFCDLVGSTALSQRLDPEELRNLNRGYQEAVTAAIERYDGYVARYMGDGVLAYFGYPRAHEDDAERSIRAGLALVDAVADLETDVPDGLAVRVGIATGPVVVGDIIGEGASQESAVVGETPNLAARLQGIATPNSVVVASSTHDLGAGRFTYEDLGPRPVKGMEKPVRAWRVIAPSVTESRFEAVFRTGLTEFVGREQEIALLLERWQAANEGDGQVILLSGEAGIGKSRVMRVFRDRLADEPHTRIRYQCSPYHTASPMHPVVQQIEFDARISAQDGVEEKLDKLERLLSLATTPDPETVALFASLLSLPSGDRYPSPALSPQERMERTFQAIVGQIEAHASARPVLVVIEDAQWIDPSTSELVERLADAAQSLRVLLLVTFRSEFDCPWSGFPHGTTLTLNRLTRHQTETVIRHVSGEKSLPDEIVEQIAAKTDGIPLYVEELTKDVLESGVLRDAGDRFELAGPLVPLAIPASLQDSLMARLDRLAPIKEIAQIGAAIGREFSYALLRGVTNRTEVDLRDALGQLTEAELIFRRGMPPDATYVFKHALVQDAAYASLLKARCQQLHSRIADVLLASHRDVVETQPELVAHHFTRAGLSESALEYWQAAAKRAIGRSSDLEAIEHLDQALALIPSLPPGEGRDKRELELHVMKLGPLFPTRGYGSHEADETSIRALEIGRRVGDNETLFPTLYARWTHEYVRSNQKALFDLAKEYLERAETADDDVARIVGHRACSAAFLYRGEVEAARRHAEEALKRYVPEKHVPLVARFGQDLKVMAMIYLALTDALLGNLDHASTLGEEAINHARSLGHANTLAYAIFHMGVWLPAMVRDAETVHRGGAELMALARRHRLRFWEAWGLPLIAVNGDGATPADVIADTEAALGHWSEKFNGRILVPQTLCHMAELLIGSGEPAQAERLLIEAAERMQADGEVVWQSELHRIRGRLAERTSPETATAEYEKAIAIARERSMKLLELRSATDLARLLVGSGDPGGARALLAPVYNWFTGGFEKPDLVNAKTVLDDLG